MTPPVKPDEKGNYTVPMPGITEFKISGIPSATLIALLSVRWSPKVFVRPRFCLQKVPAPNSPTFGKGPDKCSQETGDVRLVYAHFAICGDRGRTDVFSELVHGLDSPRYVAVAEAVFARSERGERQLPVRGRNTEI